MLLACMPACRQQRHTGDWLSLSMENLIDEVLLAAPKQFTDPNCLGYEASPGVFEQDRCVVTPEHLPSFQDFVRWAHSCWLH